MKKDQDKTKEQLANELVQVRQRVTQLEGSEAEHKRVEEALRQSEALLTAIYDSTPAVIILVDRERRTQKVNHAAVKFAGRAAGEMIGLRGGEALRCLHSLDDPKGCGFGPFCETCTVRRTVLDTFETGNSHYKVQARLPFASVKEELTFLLSTTLLSLPEEQRVLVCIEDITDLKRTEHDLNERLKELKCLYDITNIAGRRGITFDEIIQEVANLLPDAWQYPEIASARITINGKEYKTANYRETEWKQYSEIKVSGEKKGIVEVSYLEERPVVNEGLFLKEERLLIDAVTETLGRIMESKEADKREKELQKELYLSSRLAAVGELAAGIAHELNNPLTGVLGFSERLLRKSTDEKARQDLESIHNEAKRASKVVQNLLTFARRREPTKEYADINETLGRALELRAYELRISNIELVVELATDLPKTMADPYQIEEVFLNIVLNAEQAMTETHRGGKLTIKTQKVKDYIKICFTDDGPGIPAEHLDKLFDPFFTTREEKGGIGLGLSVCHGIVTEHGGKIYAKSKPGKGATITVELSLTAKTRGK